MTTPAQGTWREWRATGQDGEAIPEPGVWRDDLRSAEEDLRVLREEVEPPYDETWLETRTISKVERLEAPRV